MTKISATIITLNEERNIGRCIDSLLGIVDEVIVVDSFSSDKTESICKSKGVKFIQTDWKGYAQTKNYANSLASYSYIYSIDADEELTPELQNSVLKEKEKGLNGLYSHNRLTNYCGSWIKNMGWYPDSKVRLFPKEFAQWSGEFVHEELTFSKSLKVTHLKGDLNHYSYYSTKEHRERADKYSILTAKKMHAKGKKASFFKPYLSSLARFVSMYLLKFGFLDGKAGFIISKISAQSNILKYKELRRLNNATK